MLIRFLQFGRLSNILEKQYELIEDYSYAGCTEGDFYYADKNDCNVFAAIS